MKGLSSSHYVSVTASTGIRTTVALRVPTRAIRIPRDSFGKSISGVSFLIPMCRTHALCAINAVVNDHRRPEDSMPNADDAHALSHNPGRVTSRDVATTAYAVVGSQRPSMER